MLNYIWVGLILVGLVVAVGSDISDEFRNPMRNGIALEGRVEILKEPTGMRETWEGILVLTPDQFAAFYGISGSTEGVRLPVTLTRGATGFTMVILLNESAPRLWREMGKWATTRDRLLCIVESFRAPAGEPAQTRFVIEPIRFVKLRAVSQAAIDYAVTAVNIAIGLIGVMALWLGVVKVAEAAGMLDVLTRLLAPITRRLFPDIPPQHPAVGAMIMNIAANMLGLSNAATPFGLKAMEELNKLNPRAGVASNAMITFLAINTGGLILIPATAIAVRAAAGSANPGIIIGTSIVGAGAATIAGIAASKLLQRLPRYRKALEVDNG
jgi:spore maturation protein A